MKHLMMCHNICKKTFEYRSRDSKMPKVTKIEVQKE